MWNNLMAGAIKHPAWETQQYSKSAVSPWFVRMTMSWQENSCLESIPVKQWSIRLAQNPNSRRPG